MQILILYYSKGGNTRKLAEEIARGVDSVEGAQGVLRRTDEVSKDDFVNAAGIIAGSPVYFGLMAAQLKQIFDAYISVRKKMEGKVGAAFATSGDPSGGKETTISLNGTNEELKYAGGGLYHTEHQTYLQIQRVGDIGQGGDPVPGPHARRDRVLDPRARSGVD